MVGSLRILILLCQWIATPGIERTHGPCGNGWFSHGPFVARRKRETGRFPDLRRCSIAETV